MVGEQHLPINRRTHISLKASPILWQNEDCTVTVIDVPRSIAAAQGTLQQPCHAHLRSVVPLHNPFPSNEPKSSKASASLQNNSADQQLHGEYVGLLERALSDVRANYAGEWCLARPYVQDTPRVAKKRKLDEGTTGQGDSETTNTRTDLPDHILPGLAHAERGSVPRPHMRLLRQPSSPDDEDEAIDDDHVIVNTSVHTATLKVSASSQDEAYHFHTPPLSSFYLGSCADARSFRAAVRATAQQDSTPKTFSCILLDPPWPNRSVKRTHKTAGSTYSTISTLAAVRDVVLGMDLDMLMADDCLVGVWITNRAAVRELVLGEAGLFDCWGVELVEEWVWLKVTSSGEPVTQIDALWRKPYEVLLLGRQRRKQSYSHACVPTRPGNTAPPATDNAVKRRVIISVPDLHSRKPCLKALIEPLLVADVRSHKVLEVFARHLVAGWWSWGDECIKFNWDGYWRSSEPQHQIAS